MPETSVGQIGLDLVVNSKEFEKQVSGIQGIAKKAGAAIAGAFAVKKLMDFGGTERCRCYIPVHDIKGR